MATSTLKWDPSRLNAALVQGTRKSFYVAKDYAIATRPNSKSSATLGNVTNTSATLKPTGLGFIFEQGRQGGYPIFPGGVKGYRASKAASAINFGGPKSYTLRVKRGGTKTALKFTRGDGGFAAAVTGGAMEADPYIKPAGAWWARVGGPRTMGAVLASRGFGARL